MTIKRFSQITIALHSCLIIIFLSLPLQTFGQRTTSIRNTTFELKERTLITTYDLVSKDNEPKSIVFFLWDNNYNVLKPKSLSGDHGTNIEPGENKTIVWNLYDDNELIKGKVRPVVILEDQLRYGGAKNAFLSVIVPGLGGYFVEDYRNIRFKPYYRTASVIGLSALGVVGLQNYSREKLYTYVVNWRTNQPELTFNGYGDSSYWLFPYDYAIFFGSAAAIWLYDIIWVAAIGGKNQKLKKAYNDISFLVSNKQASFTIRKKF